MQRATLADQLAGWLAQVPDGVWRERGIELGHAAAAAILPGAPRRQLGLPRHIYIQK